MELKPITLKPKYLKANWKISKELAKSFELERDIDYYANIMHPPTEKGIQILKELDDKQS